MYRIGFSNSLKKDKKQNNKEKTKNTQIHRYRRIISFSKKNKPRTLFSGAVAKQHICHDHLYR